MISQSSCGSYSYSNGNDNNGSNNNSNNNKCPVTFPPTSLLPKSSVEKKTNRSNTHCIDDALAVLRSAKRLKQSRDEQQQQQQQQDYNDDSKPQTPPSDSSSDKSRATDLNETKHKTISVNGAQYVLPYRPRTNDWEWKMGILPPAPGGQKQHYSRRTPALYSKRLGCGTNLSFLPGILPTIIKDKKDESSFTATTTTGIMP